MKQPKKPTYEQKKVIAKRKMDWREWMVRSDDNMVLTLIHKTTKEVKEISR